jgi:hypothetical protein
LYELHLLPDRRDMTEPVLAPVELVGGATVERGPADRAPAATATAATAMAATAMAATATPGIDWGRRVETAVKDQAIDVRRFIVASLDSFASRIVSDVRDSLPVVQPLEVPKPAPRPVQPNWHWAAGIAAASLVAVAFAAIWLATREELAKSRAEIAALTSSNTELQRARTDLSATVKDLTAALASASTVAGASTGAPGAAGAPTRVEPVPYGEIPFDRGRLDVLRELLSRLEAQGFHGVVKITSLAGIFCLSGNATDGFAPAPASVLASKCDVVGNPFEESLSGQQRQSLAFANLIAGVRQRTAGAITVAMESGGSGRPSTSYPPRTESLTAGEWNRAAAANNRVEFAAESAAGPAGPGPAGPGPAGPGQ